MMKDTFVVLFVTILLRPSSCDGDHHHHQQATAAAAAKNTHSSNLVSGTQGAAIKMDQQFLYLLSVIPGKVNAAVSSISSDLSSSNLKTQSFGWALLAGGAKDVLADYIGNNRVLSDVLTMPDVVYPYGYSVGYAFGFGGPFLLPTYLNDPNLGCSGQDFQRVIGSYGLQNGITNQISQTQLEVFGLDAKLALHCVTQHSKDYKEAAEVEYLIDDLVEAGIQRIAMS